MVIRCLEIRPRDHTFTSGHSQQCNHNKYKHFNIYYSETLSCWIKNTNSLRRATKAHLKDIVPSTNECPTLYLEKLIGATNITNHKRVTHGAHTAPLHRESR